jgi:hypothetical protein
VGMMPTVPKKARCRDRGPDPFHSSVSHSGHPESWADAVVGLTAYEGLTHSVETYGTIFSTSDEALAS